MYMRPARTTCRQEARRFCSVTWSHRMKIPLLDLKQQNAAVASQLNQAFRRVMDSGQYILGPELAELERRAAALTGTTHGIGVSSGTDAILLALMALGIGPGDEVICPSFTFFATAGCIARTGAPPVFADSCPACFNLDVSDARRRVTARTRAIIPVHLFGQAACMDAALELARSANLFVIEDGAQALGAGYGDRPVGSMGHFGTFSFFPSKNLGGFGDSGLLVTNDDALAEKARLMRTHGARPKYFHAMIGGNFRMDPLQAALLSVKLDYLESYNRRRAENAAYYMARLSEIPGAAVSGATSGPCGAAAGGGGRLILPAAHPGNRHIWNQYTVRVPRLTPEDGNPRDALRAHLAAREIGSEIYYACPMHRQACFAGLPSAMLPVCERLAAECLSLPIYPELARAQQDAVVRAIMDFFERP